MTAATGKLGLVRKLGSSFLALAGLGLFLVWLGGAFGARVGPGEIRADRPTTTGRELAPVKRSLVEETITAVGSVQPRRKADVASQIIAAVLEVKVQPGDRVKPGDVLVVLDDRELVARHGEALAAVTAAEVDVDVRKRDHDRIVMIPTGAASAEEKDRITGAYTLSQALLKRSRQQVRRIEVQLTYTRIKAATPGVVADRFADPGDLAVPGKPLLAVQDTRELELHACVPESQALHVTVGQTLAIRIDAANLAGVGTVREVVPVAQQASRSVLAKVSLPADLSAPVYAGMFGRVTLPVGQSSRLLIPQAAVRQVGQLELVDVAGAGGALERRFVRTGRTFDGNVEILSGLNEGETVALPR
ncbi:MAG TPA: efflux RND transporter periplasmic adaptor subunit [Gemmataceae bacterium]|jgi:RND family efflux transporter MFP subunit